MFCATNQKGNEARDKGVHTHTHTHTQKKEIRKVKCGPTLSVKRWQIIYMCVCVYIDINYN